MTFVEPDYAGESLSNVLPSIHAQLTGGQPTLPIPQAARYVILMVDGLGWFPLMEHLDQTEWLAARAPASTPIRCGVPSSTAVSLSSLGIGTPPGEHGIVGYTFLDADRDQVVNALTWEGGAPSLDAFTIQPTAYSRLTEANFPCACVSLARFASSPLQQISFAGTTHFGVDFESDIDHVSGLVSDALITHDVVYCYERKLDHYGHAHGTGSWQWLEHLAHVDDMIMRLEESLPADTALIVTGDHGMVNVPEHKMIVIEDTPGLSGARHIAGEGRFRQIYTSDPDQLQARWSDELGDKATVLTRDAAVERGWFGPCVLPQVAPRIGDVVVAMHDDWALMSRTFPKEFSLVGMHGSLTPAEMMVPLVVAKV